MTAVPPRAGRRDRMGEAIVVLLAVAAGLMAAAAGSPRPDAGGPSDPGADPVPVDDSQWVSLLAHVGADRGLDLFAVMGFEDGKNGSVLLLPPSTLVDVPSLGTQPLSEIVRLGSPWVQVTVSNLLGININETVLLDDARLAGTFAPSVRMELDLSHEVHVVDDAGTFSLPSGNQTVDAAIAVRALLTPEADPGELAHQVTIRSVLEGWRATLRTARTAEAVRVVEPAIATIVERASTRLHYDTLPVDGISIGGATRFTARRADMERLVAERFSWAVLNGGKPRPRVEIRNGTGVVGIIPAVAALVVPAGGEVTMTGDVPGFGVATTEVGYYDEADRTAAVKLAAVLGIAKVARAADPLDVVDVTIVLGEDFPPPP